MGTPISMSDLNLVNNSAPALSADNLNPVIDGAKAAADRVDAYGLDATCAAKTSVADADEILTRDSADGNYVKKVSWTTAFAAIWTKLGALVAGGTDKATPVDADTLPLSDSAASSATKKLTFANLWTWIASKMTALAYAPQTVIQKAVKAQNEYIAITSAANCIYLAVVSNNSSGVGAAYIIVNLGGSAYAIAALKTSTDCSVAVSGADVRFTNLRADTSTLWATLTQIGW